MRFPLRGNSNPPASAMRRGFTTIHRNRWKLLGIALMAAGGWHFIPYAFPLPEGLSRAPEPSPVLLDRHGQVIRHLTLPDDTRRKNDRIEDIPSDLIACTLAAEDKRFMDHDGADYLALLRSMADAIRHGRAISGASTITQQLIKISSPPAKRNLATKLREIMAARHLEHCWSKQQILEAYFQRLNYGERRSGPSEAARYFFQKPLKELSLAECALLAGLPQAPSRLNPNRSPAAAIKRRDIVLQRLLTGHPEMKERIQLALTETLRLRPLPEKSSAPWLDKRLADGRGTQVTTTIDLPLQQEIEQIVREEISQLSEHHLTQAAVVVIDNASGEILALVSSADWNDPRGGQINGALTPRSPGSALKPFTWLLAFEHHGMHPGSIIADVPTRFRTPEGLDLPENYDHAFRGPVTVRQALACSLNIPAIRALNELGGPQPLLDFLRSLGMQTLGEDARAYGLGLTIGNAPVRLIDLTNAYATLARGGIYFPCRIFPGTPQPEARFERKSAYLIADILSDPEARAPSFGRGGPLELPFRCAAKTGTSSDFRDNWCLGFTADFTVGVWAGNFDNTPMKSLTGVAGAGPIFHRCMLRLHEGHQAHWMEQPAGLIEVRMDPRTGKISRAGRSQLIPADRMPLPASSSDYDAEGRAKLDASYAEWYHSPANLRRQELTLAEGLPSASPLKILAPHDGSTYVLDPELPRGGRLHLSTNLPGNTEWRCASLSIISGNSPTAELRPGIHTLIATDTRDGTTRQAKIRVVER
jgi:penicillin-binding protein 1C